MKSAVAAANNAFESVQKAVKQASDVAEANFQAVSTTAVNAAKSTAQTASRARKRCSCLLGSFGIQFRGPVFGRGLFFAAMS